MARINISTRVFLEADPAKALGTVVDIKGGRLFVKWDNGRTWIYAQHELREWTPDTLFRFNIRPWYGEPVETVEVEARDEDEALALLPKNVSWEYVAFEDGSYRQPLPV